MPLSGQNALLMLKQRFGSLRSYLEKQHNHFDLSFPEDISPDFIVSLRIKGIDDDETDSEDNNDIEADDESISNDSNDININDNDNDNGNQDVYYKKEGSGSEGTDDWPTEKLEINGNFDDINNIYDRESEIEIEKFSRNTVKVNVDVGMSLQEYEKMTVKDLKNLLREYSLPLAGSKEQIIDRLLGYHEMLNSENSNAANLLLDLGTKITDMTVQKKLAEMFPQVNAASGSDSASASASGSLTGKKSIDVNDRNSYAGRSNDSDSDNDSSNDDVIRNDSNKLIGSRISSRSSPLSVVASAAAASDDEWTIDRIIEMLRNSENEMVRTHLRGPCYAILYYIISYQLEY